MRITNNYEDTIHWRAFKNDDKSYIVGLKQRIVKPGQTDSWRDDLRGFNAQVERSLSSKFETAFANTEASSAALSSSER